MSEVVSFYKYPFFHNPRQREFPQALSTSALYGRFDVPGKSWRSQVANFRRWWIKAIEGVTNCHQLSDETRRDLRWCVPAGLAAGKLPQRYCYNLVCPFCYWRDYVAPTYLGLLAVKGRGALALRKTQWYTSVPHGEHWCDHVSRARPSRPRSASTAYVIVPRLIGAQLSRWQLWTREIRIVSYVDADCVVGKTNELAEYVGRAFRWPRNWYDCFDPRPRSFWQHPGEFLLEPRCRSGGRLYACSGLLRSTKGSS